jgi:threonine synthase
LTPFSVVCRRCGEKIRSDEWRWRDECGGTIDILFDLHGKQFPHLIDKGEQSLRRYAQLLPVQTLPPIHQGWTPIVKRSINEVEVNFKLEYLSAGGSFKDRGAYVSVARAKELGAQGIIVDSSGNAGIGFSLMGLLSGIDVSVFIPKHAPEGKRKLLRLLKATVRETEGDRMDVNRAALAAEQPEFVYVGHWWNPYFIEGVKTIAYEAYEQVGIVDFVVAPVGSGTMLLGLHKGYAELRELRALNEMPSFVAVQACGYSTICEDLGGKPPTAPRSKLADGIAIADPPRRCQIGDAVRKTSGHCVVVGDEEIRQALVELIDLGFVVEPTSASAYAALRQYVKAGHIKAGARVLLPLTGSGLKLTDELLALATR